MTERTKQLQLKEIFASIPDYPFNINDFDAMRSGFDNDDDTTVSSLGSCFSMHPLEDEGYLPSEIDDPEFNKWLSTYAWVPEDNGKAIESGGHQKGFARVFYYNPTARAWVEKVSPQAGKMAVYRMNGIPRLDAHLNRMLSHYKVETKVDATALTNFSLAILDYLSNAEESVKELFAAIPTHGFSNGNDGAVQFWTVAPYIYDALTKHNFDRLSAIQAVLEWGKDRKFNSDNPNDCDFPGMRNLRAQSIVYKPENYVSYWYLSRDPNAPSHQIAKHVGSFIADQIARLYQH